MSTKRRAGIAAAAIAGAGGLAVGLPKIVARRMRNRPDGEAREVLVTPIYESATLPSHDGGTIHVVIAGSGPPIVLSHGVTLSVRTWVRQLETLPAQGFRVVAFDHRGHGHSQVGESGFSVDNLGDDVRSVVERLDLRDAVLVGHSMGGIAVQSFLLRHPEVAAERIKGVVLLSTLGRVPLSGPRAAGLRSLINHLAEVVDEVLLVEDQALIEAMQLIFREHGLMVEPTGVAGLAAAIAFRERFQGARVATPLCGANLTSEQIQQWLTT